MAKVDSFPCSLKGAEADAAGQHGIQAVVGVATQEQAIARAQRDEGRGIDQAILEVRWQARDQRPERRTWRCWGLSGIDASRAR